MVASLLQTQKCKEILEPYGLVPRWLVWMQQAVLPPGSRLCLRVERLRLEIALDAEDVGDVGWVVVA